MTEVNLVVRVIDKVTTETKRIVGRFAETLKRAAVATGTFFKNFDARAFAAPLKGLKALWDGFNALGNKLNELAPDAKKYTASFGPETMKRLTDAAEAFNRFGAALNQWVGNLIASIPGLTGLLDDLGQRMKNAAGVGAQLTERAKLQVAILDAEERFANSVFRERGEFAKLTTEIDNARAALVAYDKAQEERALNEARARMGRDAAEEQRIRQRNAARGFKEITTAETLDRYGRPIDTAQQALQDLNRMMQDRAEQEWQDDLEAWRKHEAERVDVHRDAMDDISEDELHMIATMQRIREEDAAQEAELQERMAQDARQRLDKSFAEHERAMQDLSALDLERIRKAEEAMMELRASLERVADVVTDNVMTAFDSIIAGTDSVGRAFTRMVGSILADIGRMMAAEAMKKFVMQILGSAFSAASPSLSTQNGGAFDEFGGEISPLYDTLPGQASGGFVGGRNAFMIGERGPEMFVPTTSGNIITAQRSGGGASVNGVTINVNGAQDPARTAREVKAALMSMLSSDPAARQRLRVVASGGGVA